MLIRHLIAVCFFSVAALPLFGLTGGKKQTVVPFSPGDAIVGDTPSSAYLQSAAYNVRDWDFFVTADYICWRWNQAISPLSKIATRDVISTSLFTSKNVTISDFNPHYTSGFQVGLGGSLPMIDNWQVFAEYTWYKNSIDQEVSETRGNYFKEDQSGSQFSPFLQSGLLNRNAKMDFSELDVFLQRAFYLGKRLTALLGLGISNLWITQTVNSNYDVDLFLYGTVGSFADVGESKSKQTSWGIGPKIAFDSEWLLGYGLKLIGNLSTSALYTKYVWRKHTSDLISGSVDADLTSQFTRSNGYYNFVPVTETAFGFGWGSYLCNRGFHFDVSVLYDINVYWAYTNLNFNYPQNMMLHGLNIQTSFDF